MRKTSASFRLRKSIANPILVAEAVSSSPRGSSVSLPADGIFEKIGGVGNTFGGVSHPGGELSGTGDVFGGKDPVEVRDQRFAGGG